MEYYRELHKFDKSVREKIFYTKTIDTQNFEFIFIKKKVLIFTFPFC